MNYDHFAQTFSKSRIDHPWPELDYLIRVMEKSGVKSVLDIGCGNGRFVEHYEKIQNQAPLSLGDTPAQRGGYHSPLSLRDIPPQRGGQETEGYVSSPPLGGGEGGVLGSPSPVQDESGSYHRLPYLRSNTEKAKNLRKNMTEPEKKLWYQYLRNQNPRWYRQYPIDCYIVDFYCPNRKIVLEIDGESHVGREEYDGIRTDILSKYGIQVLRFTNQDIMIRFEGVCENIRTLLEKNTPCHSVTSLLKEDDTTPPYHFVTSPLKEGGRRKVTYLGIDNSSGMIEEARKLHPGYDFAVCDMLSLRVNASDTSSLIPHHFETILLLASFHHLETRDDRLQVLRDMRQLLSPGGQIMMTNWNLRDQSRYEKSQRADGDYAIKIGKYERHYHGFTLSELEELFLETGYVINENRIYEGGRNIVSIIS